MSLTLLLIRHAKSDWDNAGVSDHDRPLNNRGREAASLIGGWLQSQGYLPDTILCSSAQRTLETWAGIASKLQDAPDPQVTRALYHAEPEGILRCITKVAGECLAVIGHNPGIGTLAHLLARKAPAHPRFDDYPTGSCLVLHFDENRWDQIGNGGEVRAFVTPHDIGSAQ